MHRVWYREHYRLSPLDSRYLDSTDYDILHDFYEWAYLKKKKEGDTTNEEDSDSTETFESLDPSHRTKEYIVKADESAFNAWVEQVKSRNRKR